VRSGKPTSPTYFKDWRTSHPKQQRAINIRNQDATKSRILEMLGPFCNRCGESDPVVLQFDHVAPRMSRGPERNGGGVRTLLTGLRNGSESPFNLQVLCANCHARKTFTERRSQ